MALPRRSSGKVEVMTARVIGMMIAAPTPLSARAAIMTSAVGASAATTFAMPNNVSRPELDGHVGLRDVEARDRGDDGHQRDGHRDEDGAQLTRVRCGHP
jgi:hypothetical protein